MVSLELATLHTQSNALPTLPLWAASLTCDPQYTQLTVLTKLYQTGFPQALEIMENLENLENQDKVPYMEKSWNLKKN